MSKRRSRQELIVRLFPVCSGIPGPDARSAIHLARSTTRLATVRHAAPLHADIAVAGISLVTRSSVVPPSKPDNQ